MTAASNTSVSLLGINHVSCQTDDVEGLAQWYERVLGFQEIERPFDGNFGGKWLSGGGLMLHIIEGGAWSQLLEKFPALAKVAPAEQRPTKLYSERFGVEIPNDLRRAFEDHISFGVRDMAATLAVLDAHGIEYGQNNRRNPTQIFLSDPDGRTIELGVYGPTPALKSAKSKL